MFSFGFTSFLICCIYYSILSIACQGVFENFLSPFTKCLYLLSHHHFPMMCFIQGLLRIKFVGIRVYFILTTSFLYCDYSIPHYGIFVYWQNNQRFDLKFVQSASWQKCRPRGSCAGGSQNWKDPRQSREPSQKGGKHFGESGANGGSRTLLNHD